jgi:hypothetical protein
LEVSAAVGNLSGCETQPAAAIRRTPSDRITLIFFMGLSFRFHPYTSDGARSQAMKKFPIV